MNDHSDTDDPNGDGEGVWSPDIEQCFREALLLFPPCGRRKHILQEEGGGKMYGRNELIARHIRMRTGKIRTRKQVSSHIQVLARRKAKTENNKGSAEDLDGAHSSSPSSCIGPSLGAHSGHSQQFNDSMNQHSRHQNNHNQSQPTQNPFFDVWADRPIATKKIRLVEFSAFIEFRRQLQLQPILPMAPAAGFQAPTVALTSLTPMASSENDQSVAVNFASNGSQGLLASSQYLTNSAGLSQPQSSPHPLNPSQTMSGQFNHLPPETYPQANSQLQQPLNNNHQHHQQLNQPLNESDYMLTPSAAPIGINYQQQASSTSTGFTRHSYVKIDYRQPVCGRSNKLERIDISQFQDKFPEIVGSEGLYQRGPPDAFYLVKFWADMNNDFEYNIEDQNSYFGFSCSFETLEPFKDITCSTKACSYGLQVVEKVEKIQGALNSSTGRYSYEIERSPMCEFMIQFIKKLRQLPRASQMNSVLENFSVLQVVSSESTSEILLCLAFVFEIAPSEQQNGSQYHVYKLTKD